jgi:hypothetical protein
MFYNCISLSFLIINGNNILVDKFLNFNEFSNKTADDYAFAYLSLQKFMFLQVLIILIERTLLPVLVLPQSA